jgi:SynChlorMet cassette radical SAM/SPASM protein ScmF
MTSGCKIPENKRTELSEYPLSSLYINPTRYCNLCCSHCWVEPPVEGESPEEFSDMSNDQMIAIVSAAIPLGLSSIKLTGGEPLLRKDLEGLLNFCKASGIEIFLETNGTLVNKDVARMLSACGVSAVSVSLDSATEEINDRFRGKKGAFTGAVDGIKNLIDVGIHPEIIITLHRENMTDFKSFTRFMHELTVRDVKINIISPLGRGERLRDDGIAPSVTEVLEFNDNVDDMRGPYAGRLYVDVPAAFKKIEEIKKSGFGRCGIKNILGILSNGDVSLCGIGYLEESLVFGNIKDDPAAIKEIWLKEPFLGDLRRSIPVELEGVCGKCVFRRSCQGGCRAAVYHSERSLTAPFWFCQEAYDAGMFPATRLIPEELNVK